jgi:hypothetical protein
MLRLIHLGRLDRRGRLSPHESGVLSAKTPTSALLGMTNVEDGPNDKRPNGFGMGHVLGLG